MNKPIGSWCLVFTAIVAGSNGTAQVPATTTTPALVKKADPVANCAGTVIRLRYDAFVAGVNAGEATLELTRRGASYRVEGRARSKGLWESMQQWRAEYSVDGVMLADAATTEIGAVSDTSQPLTLNPLLPQPGHFFTLQTTPKKRREIHIEDGVLRETKNNKVRDPRPAQTGYDLLSALFFLPVCHAAARVHTGRDGYQFSRRGDVSNEVECRYDVVDEEGDKYALGMTYRKVEAMPVPAIISLQGPLPGRLVLVESAPLERDLSCR